MYIIQKKPSTSPYVMLIVYEENIYHDSLNLDIYELRTVLLQELLLPSQLNLCP